MGINLRQQHQIEPIAVIFVEDDEDIRELVTRQLKKRLRDVPVQFQTASSGNEAISLLKAGNEFHLIISDYHMKNGTGADLLCYICERALPIPFVLFTSEPEPELPCIHDQFLGVVAKMQIDRLVDCVLEMSFSTEF